MKIFGIKFKYWYNIANLVLLAVILYYVIKKYQEIEKQNPIVAKAREVATVSAKTSAKTAMQNYRVV